MTEPLAVVATQQRGDEAGGFLLLHRALRNAGDALIFERARALIGSRHPDAILDTAEAWRPLLEQVPADRLGRYRAIVVCGGPGYAPGMAGRYPIGRLEDLPPLVLLALGSGIAPGTDSQLASFHFADADRRFLDTVLARAAFIGARDPLTAELLARSGIERVLMTGDPAWYDLERIEAPVRIPATIHDIALTPPANPAAFRQAQRLFRALAAARPEAAIRVVHHRGVQRPFAALADRLGWENVDITGSAEGFEVYDRSDLHVGYRVHAHLYAVSRGTLSYLVAEDSRGIGMLRAMPGLGIPGFQTDRDLSPLRLRALELLPRIANAHRRSTSWLGARIGGVVGLPDIAEDLVARIAADQAAGFPAQVAARGVIRATLPTMQHMIDSLP